MMRLTRPLAAQLKAHRVERIYTAVVHHDIPHDRGPWTRLSDGIPIIGSAWRWCTATGKRLLPTSVVRERFKDATLIECRLETGRTHQIRVPHAIISVIR